VATPLSPAALFPAGISQFTSRLVSLATGVRLRVVESGPLAGPPVVMLHGWGACAYTFRHALASLPTHGFRAIAVDLRGHGLSDRPSVSGAYTLDAYAADLAALQDLLELPRVALLGHSMGGGLALRYALQRPQRVSALALVNPTGLVDVRWVALMRLVPRAMVQALGERLVPRWLVAFIMRRLAFADASGVRIVC
jgi:pimeloyl-ACP methyl ester carboxylesterase